MTVKITAPDYIDLGKDGSKWKHGYIPENPAAVALKDHKRLGSSGSSKTAKKVSTPKYNAKADVAANYPGKNDNKTGTSAAKITNYAGLKKSASTKSDSALASDMRSSDPATKRAAQSERDHRDIANAKSGGKVTLKGNDSYNLTTGKKTSGKKAQLKTSARPTSGSKTRSAQPKVVVHLGNSDALAARQEATGSSSSGVNSNLWQLSPARLTEAINTPGVDPLRLTALKKEKAARIAKVSQLLGQKTSVDAGLKKIKDPSKISGFLHRKAPKFVATAYDKVTSGGKKVKSADHAQSIVDSIWDFAVKAIGGAGMIVLAAHTGINFGSA